MALFPIEGGENLEFAAVMGVAGGVAYPFETEVGGEGVMDQGALEVLADIAASGADAQHRERPCAEHVDPALVRVDADGGLVEVLDGDEDAAEQPGELLDEGRGAPGHGGDRGLGDPDPEEIGHEFAQALFGDELRVTQIGHEGGDSRSVLDGGLDAFGEGGPRQAGAEAATATVDAMFGDLEGARLGEADDGDGATIGLGDALKERGWSHPH